MPLFSRPKTIEELTAELAEIDAEIAALPSKSDSFVKARGIIEAHRATAPTEQIDAMLAREGLPSIAQCGTMSAKDIAPLAQLNLRRKSVARKLAHAKKRTAEG